MRRSCRCRDGKPSLKVYTTYERLHVDDRQILDVMAVTSTRHAQTYGLYPRKGTIAVGADTDLAIWDPAKRVRVTKALLHDNAGYTPYEGRDLTGWPVVVISRGEVIVEDGKLHAERGRGQFVACERADAFKPLGRQVPEMAQLAAWNTPLQLCRTR